MRAPDRFPKIRLAVGRLRHALPLIAGLVACISCDGRATESGVLLGWFDGARYRTTWIVIDDSTARVAAELPDIVVPRADGLWRVGVATLCHEDGTRQVVWEAPASQVPMVPGRPCPVPDDSARAPEPEPEPVVDDTVYVFRQPEDCDASEASILFVSGSHIAELINHRQTEECEPRGGRYTYVNRVRALGSPTPISLPAVFGDRALEAYEAAVRRAHAIVIREMNCPEPELEEPDLESWAIEHQRGAWRAMAIDNTWALCEYEDTLGLPLPDSIASTSPATPDWHAMSAAVPGLIDYHAAPSGRVVIATSGDHRTPERLTVHRVRSGRVGPALLELPAPSHRPFVMARWAEGRTARDWSTSLDRLAANPGAAPRDSTSLPVAPHSAPATRP